MRRTFPHMPSMVRIVLHARKLFAAWYIRHGDGSKMAVTTGIDTKDHRKKAAKLVGVGRLVSMKSTQQLVVCSSKVYLMGKATSSRGVIC
ncbi:hypothetical protein E2C01_066666 [Portunus trituberculatus]|uniref:Uncharacterized protein n=1 Tax=Portunus trituberculatus TaxID=210409 RepID=A0A5B7HM54_PORTR|nr:hypothetical protein [Portunus trituberculatus]